MFHGETTFPVRNITSPDIHVNTYTRFLLRKLFEVWWSQITRKIRWSITNKKFLIPLKVEGCCHGPIQPAIHYLIWTRFPGIWTRQRHSSNLPLQWVHGTINENFKILSALFVFFTRLLLCRQHAATITIRAQHTRLIETKRSFSITMPRR